MIIEKASASVLERLNLKTILGNPGADSQLSDICCKKGSVVMNISSLAIDLLGWVAFIMVVYASIMYLISYGDESRAEIAKKTLLWSIVGVCVAFLSHWIISLVYNSFK